MHSLKLKPSLIKLTKSHRLYELDIPIVGLTGGIATGKSTVSKLFSKENYLVIDADNLIHNIYKSSKTVEFIRGLRANCVINNEVDFKQLRVEFFNDSKLKQTITTYLYQKLPEQFKLSMQARPDAEVLIYDVPLLFENQLERVMDLTLTVYCPESTQLERVMKRDQISKDLAKKILEQQINIEQKKSLSDYVLENTGNLEELKSKFQELTKELFL